MAAPERANYATAEEWAKAFDAWAKAAEAGSLVKILREKLIGLQVCAPADMTKEEVEAETNAIHPTGISSKWSIEGRVDNPVQCAEDPSRRHWVLVC